MRILIFGATGMVGQGVLRESVLAAQVESVATIGRTATGTRHAKLQEIVHENLFDYSTIESQLTGFTACFFCLGISASGMSEAEYTRLTYELTLAAATALARLNPGMTLIYVSGAGADSSESSRTMWARVRGRTENAVQRLPLKAYSFRPAMIQPLHGARSKTAAYRTFYALTAPLMPLLRWLFPKSILTTEIIGVAMLEVAQHGAPRAVLETADISAAARRARKPY